MDTRALNVHRIGAEGHRKQLVNNTARDVPHKAMQSGEKRSGSSNLDGSGPPLQRALFSSGDTASMFCMFATAVEAAISAVAITDAPRLNWAPAYPQHGAD